MAPWEDRWQVRPAGDAASLLVRLRRRLRSRKLAREAILIGGVLAAYEAGRILAEPDPVSAAARARWILGLEAQLGLALERELQQLVLGRGPATAVLNNYYSLMFLAPNVAFLAWVYLARPGWFPLVRNVAIVGDGIAFLFHWLVPVAPPRLVPGAGYVDTLAAAGHPLGYGSAAMADVTNAYAAMPSLHFGWALLVGGGVVVLGRSRWRWLASLHPALMFLAIVATGNHFVLDAVGGALVVVASVGLVLGTCRLARNPEGGGSERGVLLGCRRLR